MILIVFLAAAQLSRSILVSDRTGLHGEVVSTDNESKLVADWLSGSRQAVPTLLNSTTTSLELEIKNLDCHGPCLLLTFQWEYRIDYSVMGLRRQEWIRCPTSKARINLEGLSPGTTYNVRVKPTYLDKHFMSHVTAKTCNYSGTLGPPGDLRASRSLGSEVNLLWHLPDMGCGTVASFTVRVASVNGTVLQDHVYRTADQPVSYMYTYKVHGLEPSRAYRILVSRDNQSHFAAVKVPRRIPLYVEHNHTNDGRVRIIVPALPSLEPNRYFSVLACSLREEYTDRSLQYSALGENVIGEVKNCNENVTTCWKAAEIQRVSSGSVFVLGADGDCRDAGHVCNKALEEGRLYAVFLVQVTPAGEPCEVVALETPIAAPIATDTTTSSPETPTEITTLVPVALSCLLLLLIVTLVIYYFVIKTRREVEQMEATKRAREAQSRGRSASDAEWMALEAHLGILAMAIPSNPGPETPARTIHKRVAVEDLEEYVLTALASGDLQRQHRLFPTGAVLPFYYGELPANRDKNRYGNLIAYDETRVKLEKTPNDKYSDYINANYIDGYKSKNFYIATQGPKANTVVDFWRMVWQYKVQVICMLANVWEGGKVKCEQYWPDLGRQVSHGEVSVMTTACQVFADFTFRRFTASCQGKERHIQQLHFTSWPDHGVPLYTQSVAVFLRHLLAAPQGDGPVLVHCSAGVGRTGAIILADINLRMAAAEQAVDVLHYQQKIRDQRPNMVSNVDQYIMVHLALLECLIEEPTGLSCEGDFRARLDALREDGALNRQYRLLNKRCSHDQAMVAYHEVLNDPPDVLKNGASVHACTVNGFRVKSQFVVAVLPTIETIADFWNLVVERKISVIVRMNEAHPSETADGVWPEQEIPLRPTPDIEVSLVRATMDEHRTLHSLQMRVGERKTPVHLLKLRTLSLRTGELPPHAHLLALWEEAERLHGGRGSILVTCRDSVTDCGLFVALAFLIERVKLEQICDVSHAIRTVRQDCKEFVRSKEQFEYLYEATTTFLESFQTYANFQ